LTSSSTANGIKNHSYLIRGRLTQRDYNLIVIATNAEAELSPPVVKEHADFVEGDRETTMTFVNTVNAAELVI
jgi:broad-specificity NMP kinase